MIPEEPIYFDHDDSQASPRGRRDRFTNPELAGMLQNYADTALPVTATAFDYGVLSGVGRSSILEGIRYTVGNAGRAGFNMAKAMSHIVNDPNINGFTERVYTANTQNWPPDTDLPEVLLFEKPVGGGVSLDAERRVLVPVTLRAAEELYRAFIKRRYVEPGTEYDTAHKEDAFDILGDEAVLRRSAMTVDGKPWREARRAMNPSIVERSYAAEFQDTTSRLMHQMLNRLGTETKSVDFKKLMNNITAHNLLRTVFGVENPDENMLTSLFAGADSLYRLIAANAFSNVPYQEQPDYLETAAHFDNVRKNLCNIMADRLDSLAEGTGSSTKDLVSDLLTATGLPLDADPAIIQELANSLRTAEPEPGKYNRLDHPNAVLSDILDYLNVPAEMRHLDMSSSVDQLVLMIFAGYETTAAAATRFGHEYMSNPELQQQLKSAVDSCKDEYGHINLQALYTNEDMVSAMLEILRLYPGLDNTSRVYEALDPNDNVRVIFPIGLINRDKSVFGEDADKFNPSRYKNNPRLMKRSLTFGVGALACPASKNFVPQELLTIIAYLVDLFDVAPDPKKPVTKRDVRHTPVFHLKNMNALMSSRRQKRKVQSE